MTAKEDWKCVLKRSKLFISGRSLLQRASLCFYYLLWYLCIFKSSVFSNVIKITIVV